MTVDDKVFAQDLSPMRCAVSSLVWISALYVHAQSTVCTTQLSKSTSSLVSCLVSFEGEVIVQGDEGPVCGVAQVVDCHGVTVGHQERKR